MGNRGKILYNSNNNIFKELRLLFLMEENKKESEGDNSRPHFVKVIEYAEEPWRTDLIFGLKGSNSHCHLALSGAVSWYFRDGDTKEIIVNGSVVKNG